MSRGYKALYRLLFFVLLALSILQLSYGQVKRPDAVTYKILGISVENTTGGSGTEPAAVIANSGLKVGEEITVPGDQVHQAIQRLWALKIFSDVQVLIDNKIDNGIYLLIRIKEYPRFDHLDIHGTDDVSEDDVKKKVPFAKGQVLTQEDINKAVRAIKRLYEEEGHLLAEVVAETSSVDPGKSNYVTLRLNINEGAGVSIDQVEFAGNTAFSSGDLRGAFDDTKEKVWWQFWSHPKFDKRKFATDKDKLLKFYRKNGYLDAEIASDTTWYSSDKKKITVLVNVREGDQYKIRHIEWEGNSVYPVEVLNGRLGLVPGQVFNNEQFEQNLRSNPDQNDVASLYLDNGYLKFNLDPDIRRVAKDSIDITIHVFERNQFRIGQVEIKGNRKTNDNVIRRELFTRPGDYFDRSAIIRSLRQLSQLNYFNPEKLRPDTKLVDDQTVDLVYEVEEKSSDNVNASVGYSGAFGVTGALGFTINNFSLREPLSGGAGQILNFDWQFGEGSRFRTFSLSFTEPWLYNTPTTFGVSLFDTRQVFVYDLQQTGISVRIGRGRLSWLDVYSRLDYNVRFQRNDVHDGGGFYLPGLTTQFSVSQTISRNSTDSPIFPANGSVVSLTTEVSGGPVLPGNVDYHKWLFNAEWFTPLFGSNKLVLAASSNLGYIDGFGTHSNIPPVELFFMGGTGIGLISTTSLRGYEDRKVGPQDNATNELGGHVLDKHSLELRYALAMNPIPIYILGFAEGGNVFTDFQHTDFFDLKRSYGFGARLLIQPIGMIGFDYGYGVDDVYPKDGNPDGWKFHFQFGRGF